MKKSLLLEIGSEEIPAGFIPIALAFMQERMEKIFKELNLDHGTIKAFGTPRRLAVMVEKIPENLPDAKETKMGPPKKIAFDESGNPTKVALGFANSAGVDIADITIANTPKGEYLCVSKVTPGRPAEEVLPGILSQIIGEIPFRKTMKWANPEVRFARPVHWILSLYGDKILPVSFGDVTAGNISAGNRFMARKPIKIKTPKAYETALEKAYVIPDVERRKNLIWEKATEIAGKINGEIRDKDLLDEVVNLVEYPHMIMGNFDERFLDMPKEVLVTVMKHHQRYFPVYKSGDETKLMSCFLGASNIIPKDEAIVRTGYERVLKARLEDGKYFFTEDLKTPLEEYARRLADVVFHKDLGTSHEKVERFTRIATTIAEQIAPDKKDKVKSAAMLCKGDLNSLMVYEFPELQGIMGREYALKQGIDPEVAVAIYEHYLPTSSKADLPQGIVGALVGIADRIDTICGCFGIGEIPTGTSDPYALRRQAIAILNIVLDKGYRISLPKLISLSLELLSSKIKGDAQTLKQQILEFFKSRFVMILQDRGISGDVVEAALAPGFDDPVDAFMRASALNLAKEEPWFASICAASKRVENILKKVAIDTSLSPDLFAQQEEKDLYAKFKEVEAPFVDYAAKGDYASALKLLASLKSPIDTFFDKVLVMAEDANVKNNRIALLKGLVDMFSGIARFSCVRT
jgi:glycyl-tRNA synthetase beta chain